MAKLILQTELMQHSSTVKYGLTDTAITQFLSGNFNFLFLTDCSAQY
jgi:hypothetical protein